MEYVRRMFRKPISKTIQSMPSGILASGYSGQRFFSCPWDHLCYIKRLEFARDCTVSGCVGIKVYDAFTHPHGTSADTSGLVLRKHMTLPTDTKDYTWDVDEDIPLLGDLIVVAEQSGLHVTCTVRTLGA